MLNFDITHAGTIYPQTTWDQALASGIPDAAVVAAARAHLTSVFERDVELIRETLHPASATKLTVYRIKEEIANDPASASAAELALIDAEAVARGTDRAGLLAIFLNKASVLRLTVLTLETGSAGGKALLAAALDTEADLVAAYGTARAVLAAARTDAQTLLEAL